MADLQQALALHRAGELARAERAYRELLDASPADADALNLLGMLLAQTGREPEAAERFAAAVALYPKNETFRLNYADSLARLRKTAEAEAEFRGALEVSDPSAEASARFGLFLAQQDRFAEAEPFLKRSVEAAPEVAAYWTNYGNALRKLGQLAPAVAAFEVALAREPRNPVALNCLGEALQARGEKARALELFRQAAAARPGDATPLANLGLALAEAGKLSESLERLSEAASARPGDPLILASLGAALRDARRIEEAIERLQQAAAMAPEDARVVSKFLYTLNFHPDAAALDVDAASKAIDRCFPARRAAPALDAEGGAPLRAGFLSGDFSAHSVAYFLLPLFEQLDRARVRIHCYSECAAPDSLTARFKELADDWRETAGQSASEVAQWIRDDRIDVLIDLAGHTGGSRLDVVAESPAPTIVNWLGYPNRVGLSALDFRLVDAVTDPREPGEAEASSERLHRMDGCFLAYRPPYALPEVAPTPRVRNGYVTFGSFNNAAKINDRVVAAWSEILARTPGSRLLLKSWQFEDDAVRSALAEGFTRRGIEPERLRFSPRLAGYAEHMALYGEIDIALDTFPYNGTTTTCEALWMGAPVVAFVGDRHASRVGASLLRAAGMPKLVANSLDGYIALAVELASQPERLASRRLEARAALERSQLGDAAGFARHFESALYAMRDARTQSVDTILEEALSKHRAGRIAEALSLYEEAMRREPERDDAARYAGVALYALGRHREAETHFARAARAFPDQPDVFTNWGSALQRIGSFDEAARAHERAMELSPNDPVILGNYANALVDMGRAGEALPFFRRSLDLRDRDARVWTNYSIALKESGALAKAMEAAQRAVALDPDFGGARSNLGALQVAFGQADEAVATLAEATRREPGNRAAWSNLLYAMQYSDTVVLSEISDASARFGALMEGARRSAKPPTMKERIRIGFVSADLREHAVARFLLPLLGARGAFAGEVVLYSDSGVEDDWTRRLQRASDAWRSIAGMTDESAAALVEEDAVDLLIDLGGHSARNRLGLFALKPAPIQATWLGFPGSTGLRAVDWRIADADTLTDDEAARFPEEPIRLPEGFHTIRFEVAAPVSQQPALTRNDGVFTFGSFNNLAKLSPRALRLWARILERCPNAHLALKSYQLRDPEMRALWLKRFEALGVASSRILFLDPAHGYAQHLACYGQIDLALDTLPYNGTTTTCEALWMGVPVLTALGDRACARVGASLLKTVGLGEFVCESDEAYVEAAIAWSRRPGDLAALRAGLRARFERSALGDPARFAKRLFGALVERYQLAAARALRGWIERIEYSDAATDGEVEHALGEGIFPERLEGESVLDASCVDGFWAAEAIRRGASSAVCMPASGFWEGAADGGFAFAREAYAQATGRLLGLDAARWRVERTPFERAPEPEAADWLFFNVNANHLADPAAALSRLRAACRSGLILSLQVRDEDSAFSDEDREQGTAWLPTQAELADVLRSAGFVQERATEYELGPGRSWIVLRARPGEPC